MKREHIGQIQVALAAVSWSFAGMFMRLCPWNAFTKNGVRSLVAALLLAASRGTFRVRMTKGTVLGALGVALTSILFTLANGMTTSANAIVLQYAMPVFVIAFSWLFFGQRPTVRSLVIAGFILLGVVLCSWEGLAAGDNLGNLLALLSAITFAMVFFCSRIPGANARDYAYLGILLCVPTSVCGFFDPAMSADPVPWLVAVGLGICLAGGYYFISLGVSKVSPLSAALISNLEPILNPLWVAIYPGERPGVLALVGAAIVLTSATVYAISGSGE